MLARPGASVTPVSKVKFIARGGYYHEVRIRTVIGSVVCNRRLMVTLLIGYCCFVPFGVSGFLVLVLFLCVFCYVSLNSLIQTVSGFRLRVFVVRRHTVPNL